MNRMQEKCLVVDRDRVRLFQCCGILSVILSMNDEAWISSGAYIVYVVLEGIPIVFFLLGFLYIHRRKEGLLAQNTAPPYTDDDIY